MRILAYTTKEDVEIYVEPGNKSINDFRVRYKEPERKLRTPKHIHLIVDLYLKRAGNRELTLKLINLFLKMLAQLQPSQEFPPKFQTFRKEFLEEFNELDKYGEYSVEFLTAVFDLIMIQEKTNYPNGTINRKLFETFLAEKDIFSVVSAATFRGGA